MRQKGRVCSNAVTGTSVLYNLLVMKLKYTFIILSYCSIINMVGSMLYSMLFTFPPC